MKAFPHTIPESSSDGKTVAHGMDLRDWFAGQALSGIMANPERWKNIAERYESKQITYHEASESNAIKAYDIADAMLKAREVSND